MKEEYVQARNSPLTREFQVYQSLREQTGFPRIYCFSEVAGYRVMVMELLGPSLEDLVVYHGRSLGLQTVSWVACTLLERIEELHEQSWIHGDIKPQNFLLDATGDQVDIVMIDLGLARRYRDPQTEEHYPARVTYTPLGTPRFASVARHCGDPCSRRDDMESLGYLLVYLCRGCLPWQGLIGSIDAKLEQILVSKVRTSPQELCHGLSPEFLQYFKHISCLEFADKPDYLGLWKAFDDLHQRCRRGEPHL